MQRADFAALLLDAAEEGTSRDRAPQNQHWAPVLPVDGTIHV
jgi:hypothetical protein